MSQINSLKDEKKRIFIDLDNTEGEIQDLNYKNGELDKIVKSLDYENNSLEKNLTQFSNQKADVIFFFNNNLIFPISSRTKRKKNQKF